ncbi:MAG TPA: helix-turn-helix transcriptional regulator [Pyrinomonadaceae bacterium]|jgi:cytoskeletal protein RodZ
MAASFGEQLRLAREARGVSLREISEQTRISIRYLEAIEGDDYKRLPGGIFNRSFIKAYAKHIGFDEKEAVEGYQRMMREQGDSADDVATTPYQSRVYTDGNTRSPIVTLLLTVLILAILSLGAYAALHWYQRRGDTQTDNAAPATNGQSNPAAANPSPATATSQTAATDEFNVQVKAVNGLVWVRVYLDDSAQSAFANNLAADETREFKPARSLRIQCAKDKPDSLGITINGRPAKVPADFKKGKLAEILITKDDYQRFLQ